MQQFVGIFVIDRAPGTIRYIEKNESLVAAWQKDSRMPQLPASALRQFIHFLMTSKSDNEQRRRIVCSGFRHQHQKGGAHLLASGGDFDGALFAGIGNQAEMRAADLQPSRVRSPGIYRCQHEQAKEQNTRRAKTSHVW